MGKYKAKKTNNEEKIKSVKVKKIKNKPFLSDTQIEIRRLIRIIIIIIVLVVAVYFFSVAVVNKRTSSTNTSTTAGEIQYDNISVGMILNRPYDEYYVIVYDSEDSKSVYYSSLAYSYSSTTDALKIYTCDLNNALNSDYKATDSSNPKAKTIDELSFGEITLLHVKNSKITEYVDNIDTIKDILK